MTRSIVPAALLLLAACSKPHAGAEAGAADTTQSAATASDTAHAAPVVLFVGTSLTAGYGLAPEQAYPALIQQKIDSAGLDYRVVNAGVSGETSAGALRRMPWLLKQPFDVFVLETGANDMLRGTELDSTRANIQAIIDQAKAARPDARIVLVGMLAPPNLGPEYTAKFRSLYPELARKNHLVLVPFLLEGVAGVRDLNQPDGIHPNARGEKILAETVWKTLAPVLEEGNSSQYSVLSAQAGLNALSTGN
jgi:acyl-CoA thioesterase-1